MFARGLTTGVALATLVALASSAGVAAASASPRPAPGRDPGYSQVVPTSDGNRGAQVPFTQYSAVNAQNTGTVIGPSDNLYTLPAEAIGRTAVTLNGAGQYVQFTLVKPANSVDLRYSIPDSADGTGLTTPLKVYVNGQARPDLTLSSTYDWFYGSYPFTNDPADLDGHHMYDDVRTLFGRTLPAGTQVRFEIADPSIPVTLNVADFEQVAPPAPQPRGSISVLSYGADPTGQTDSTTAIQNAINAGSAAGKAVYIPPGNFLVTSHLIVNNVTLTGAGEWYSVLGGNGVGVFGNFAPTPSTNVHLSNFAIYGQVNARVDSEDFMGIGGSLQDSTISDVWIQHVQAGIWMTGPFTNLKISNVRIQDTVADGINFDGGITDSSVTNTYIRNTGDDGIALWSNGVADANDTISHDTVQLPVLANNFAIYGGSDNSIVNDYGTDTITQGGGIQVGNRFSAVPLAGTTTIADNTLVRAGTLDPNWKFGVGAIWFYASDGEDMTGTINVDHNTIIDSPYDAFGFVGDYIPNATPPAYAIDNVNINDNIVHNVGSFVFQLQSAGSNDTISNVVSTGTVGLDGTMACGYGITPTYGSGNTGWSGSECTFPPFNILVHVDLVGAVRAGQPQHPEPGADGHDHQPGTGRGADLVGLRDRRIRRDQQLPGDARGRGQLHGHRHRHADRRAAVPGQPGIRRQPAHQPVRAVRGQPERGRLQPGRQPRADGDRLGRQHPGRVPGQQRQRRQPGHLLAGGQRQRRAHAAAGRGGARLTGWCSSFRRAGATGTRPSRSTAAPTAPTGPSWWRRRPTCSAPTTRPATTSSASPSHPPR